MSKKNNYVSLAFDVGGTSIKSGIVDSELNTISQSLLTTPVNSSGTCEEIISAFKAAIDAGKEFASNAGLRIDKLGVATCGPFDYENGISLMQDDKFSAIYMLNMKELLEKMFAPENITVNFMHDVKAFLAGQAVINPELSTGKTIAITLGTGIGSAFMIDGEIVYHGKGVLEKAIGLHSFREKYLEYYIGQKGLLKRYRELNPPNITDSIKEIQQYAENGEEAALKMFEELGDILGEAILPVITKFQAGRIILGGGIAKGFQLFQHTLSNRIPKSFKNVYLAEKLKESALIGVSR